MEIEIYDSDDVIQAIDTDQRQSYRLPTTPDAGTVVLRCGRRQWIVRLLNESAGGFAVELERLLRNVTVGGCVDVRTRVGWHRCEIVYRNDDDPAAVRIGLQRLEDLPDPRDRASQNVNTLSTSRSGVPWAGILAALSVSAAIAVVAVVNGWLPYSG